MYNNNHTIILTKVTLVIRSFKNFNYFRKKRSLIGIYYILELFPVYQVNIFCQISCVISSFSGLENINN